MTKLSCLPALFVSCVAVAAPTKAEVSAAASIAYIKSAMDFDRDRLPVFTDGGAPENHFLVWARFPADKNPKATFVGINAFDAKDRHSGKTAIECTFKPDRNHAFGGFVFLHGAREFQLGQADADGKPPSNAMGEKDWAKQFGEVPAAYADLTGATELTFWARGTTGNEHVTFFVGGLGHDVSTDLKTVLYPDSTRAIKLERKLKPVWTKYTITLTGVDLRRIQAGFGWVTAEHDNPDGAVFYLDDIEFGLNSTAKSSRLAQPRFVRSYLTQDFGDYDKLSDSFDYTYQGVADLYDNAMAILAFLAEGSNDDLVRGCLIGDAIVYAASHDRALDAVLKNPDLRLLRSHYSVGELVMPAGWQVLDGNGQGHTNLASLPTFYLPQEERSYEISDPDMDVDPFAPASRFRKHFHAGIVDTGNNAWAIIALVSLYKATSEAKYLDTAKSIGLAIKTCFSDGKNGFKGGYEKVDTGYIERPYTSVEHCIDLADAFELLSEQTKDASWRACADSAKAFVVSMRSKDGKAQLLAGTSPPRADGKVVIAPVPVDVQCWSILAIPGIQTTIPGLLDETMKRFQWTDGNLQGCSFAVPLKKTMEGIWSEGTAHLVCALQAANRGGEAEPYLETLRHLQAESGGLYATEKPEGLDSGFGFAYQHRIHLGATAWNVFAQLGKNPYRIGFPAIPTPPAAPEDGLEMVAYGGGSIRTNHFDHPKERSVLGLDNTEIRLILGSQLAPYSLRPYLNLAPALGSEDVPTSNQLVRGLGVEVRPFTTPMLRARYATLSPVRLYVQASGNTFLRSAPTFPVPRHDLAIGFDYWRQTDFLESGKNRRYERNWSESYVGATYHTTNFGLYDYNAIVCGIDYKRGWVFGSPRLPLMPYVHAALNFSTAHDERFWENDLIGGIGLRTDRQIRNDIRVGLYAEAMGILRYLRDSPPFGNVPNKDYRIGFYIQWNHY